jgi:cytochrome c
MKNNHALRTSSAMKSFEGNKIFAAILIALILYVGSGIVSKTVFHGEHGAKEDATRAYPVMENQPVVAAAKTEAPKGPEPISALLASADVAAGQALSKKCSACHSFDEGGPNKVGPHLWNIVGHPKASIEGFTYSAALKAMAGEAWDYEKLNGFLYNPKAYAPGTKMGFVGLPDAQDRANMIAYLRSLSKDPKPLP